MSNFEKIKKNIFGLSFSNNFVRAQSDDLESTGECKQLMPLPPRQFDLQKIDYPHSQYVACDMTYDG